ncbi:NADPH-dependent 2,4-dienoyl-CoA reductase, sulfur reductase [Pilibacter termitis]|uniref:NADPH-dependent 2,4-dienoyl-CoA reductase, sulfur reductase n=1 Tax=Pilibacter termitis TaxID=263852 RepID=A0A1T4N440_9ENTE|nr:FAD-dependent oxidoreductase [Pilibacter termitis]SJZ73904.1 NADPH-dependent 2,4-dienoyl-CoA reductase, sulfur reductase [Pilibacter termitis]
MKIVIIGGVAAGTSVAAKARRNDEQAEIVIFDKDTDISYAVCGIPYVFTGEVENFDELSPRDTTFFKEKYNVDIFTRHEVLDVSYQEKKIIVKNLKNDEIFEEHFDKLVFATGTYFNTPEVFQNVQAKNVFSVKDITSGKNIMNYLEQEEANSVVIIGGGFVGLEMAEQLKKRGIATSIVVPHNQVMSTFDEDLALRIEDEITRQGIWLIKNSEIVEIQGDKRVKTLVLEGDQELSADFFIVATGVKPLVTLAEKIGVKLGETGAIQVNSSMETNLENVYATGDVAEKFSRINGKPLWLPLATHANKEGRIAGDAMTGGSSRNQGILGTSILRFFDLTIGQTGLSEKMAKKQGYDVEILYNQKNDRPNYISDKKILIKAVADRKTHQLLGVQIIGNAGVDKRLDVFATALSFGAKAEDLFQLDLAYSPVYSTTKDPVNYTGMALTNALSRGKMITPAKLLSWLEAGEELQLIDARPLQEYAENHIEGAKNIPLKELRTHLQGLDKEKRVVVYCNTGVTANAAQNILLNEGFKEVYNLNGGNVNYQMMRNHMDG